MIMLSGMTLCVVSCRFDSDKWKNDARVDHSLFEISGSTTACTRLPTAQIIDRTLPATMSLVAVGLVDPVAGEA